MMYNVYDVCVSGNMENLYLKGSKDTNYTILSRIKLSVYDEFHWTNFIYIQFKLISKLWFYGPSIQEKPSIVFSYLYFFFDIIHKILSLG